MDESMNRLDGLNNRPLTRLEALEEMSSEPLNRLEQNRRKSQLEMDAVNRLASQRQLGIETDRSTTAQLRIDLREQVKNSSRIKEDQELMKTLSGIFSDRVDSVRERIDSGEYKLIEPNEKYITNEMEVDAAIAKALSHENDEEMMAALKEVEHKYLKANFERHTDYKEFERRKIDTMREMANDSGNNWSDVLKRGFKSYIAGGAGAGIALSMVTGDDKMARAYHEVKTLPELAYSAHDLLDFTAIATGSTIPYASAVALGAIGGSSLGPGGALAGGGMVSALMSGSNKYYEMLDEGATHDQAAMGATMHGILSAVIESVSFGTGKAAKPLLKARSMTNFARRMATGQGSGLAYGTGGLFRTMAREALEEGFQEGSSYLSSYIAAGILPTDVNGDIDWGEIVDRVTEASLGGLLVGGITKLGARGSARMTSLVAGPAGIFTPGAIETSLKNSKVVATARSEEGNIKIVELPGGHKVAVSDNASLIEQGSDPGKLNIGQYLHGEKTVRVGDVEHNVEGVILYDKENMGDNNVITHEAAHWYANKVLEADPVKYSQYLKEIADAYGLNDVADNEIIPQAITMRDQTKGIKNILRQFKGDMKATLDIMLNKDKASEKSKAIDFLLQAETEIGKRDSYMRGLNQNIADSVAKFTDKLTPKEGTETNDFMTIDIDKDGQGKKKASDIDDEINYPALTRYNKENPPLPQSSQQSNVKPKPERQVRKVMFAENQGLSNKTTQDMDAPRRNLSIKQEATGKKDVEGTKQSNTFVEVSEAHVADYQRRAVRPYLEREAEKVIHDLRERRASAPMDEIVKNAIQHVKASYENMSDEQIVRAVAMGFDPFETDPKFDYITNPGDPSYNTYQVSDKVVVGRGLILQMIEAHKEGNLPEVLNIPGTDITIDLTAITATHNMAIEARNAMKSTSSIKRFIAKYSRDTKTVLPRRVDLMSESMMASLIALTIANKNNISIKPPFGQVMYYIIEAMTWKKHLSGQTRLPSMTKIYAARGMIISIKRKLEEGEITEYQYSVAFRAIANELKKISRQDLAYVIPSSFDEKTQSKLSELGVEFHAINIESETTELLNLGNINRPSRVPAWKGPLVTKKASPKLLDWSFDRRGSVGKDGKSYVQHLSPSEHRGSESVIIQAKWKINSLKKMRESGRLSRDEYADYIKRIGAELNTIAKEIKKKYIHKHFNKEQIAFLGIDVNYESDPEFEEAFLLGGTGSSDGASSWSTSAAARVNRGKDPFRKEIDIDGSDVYDERDWTWETEMGSEPYRARTFLETDLSIRSVFKGIDETVGEYKARLEVLRKEKLRAMDAEMLELLASAGKVKKVTREDFKYRIAYTKAELKRILQIKPGETREQYNYRVNLEENTLWDEIYKMEEADNPDIKVEKVYREEALLANTLEQAESIQKAIEKSKARKLANIDPEAIIAFARQGRWDVVEYSLKRLQAMDVRNIYNPQGRYLAQEYLHENSEVPVRVRRTEGEVNWTVKAGWTNYVIALANLLHYAYRIPMHVDAMHIKPVDMKQFSDKHGEYAAGNLSLEGGSLKNYDAYDLAYSIYTEAMSDWSVTETEFANLAGDLGVMAANEITKVTQRYVERYMRDTKGILPNFKDTDAIIETEPEFEGKEGFARVKDQIASATASLVLKQEQEARRDLAKATHEGNQAEINRINKYLANLSVIERADLEVQSAYLDRETGSNFKERLDRLTTKKKSNYREFLEGMLKDYGKDNSEFNDMVEDMPTEVLENVCGFLQKQALKGEPIVSKVTEPIIEVSKDFMTVDVTDDVKVKAVWRDMIGLKHVARVAAMVESDRMRKAIITSLDIKDGIADKAAKKFVKVIYGQEGPNMSRVNTEAYKTSAFAATLLIDQMQYGKKSTSKAEKLLKALDKGKFKDDPYAQSLGKAYRLLKEWNEKGSKTKDAVMDVYEKHMKVSNDSYAKIYSRFNMKGVDGKNFKKLKHYLPTIYDVEPDNTVSASPEAESGFHGRFTERVFPGGIMDAFWKGYQLKYTDISQLMEVGHSQARNSLIDHVIMKYMKKNGLMLDLHGEVDGISVEVAAPEGYKKAYIPGHGEAYFPEKFADSLTIAYKKNPLREHAWFNELMSWNVFAKMSRLAGTLFHQHALIKSLTLAGSTIITSPKQLKKELIKGRESLNKFDSSAIDFLKTTLSQLSKNDPYVKMKGDEKNALVESVFSGLTLFQSNDIGQEVKLPARLDKMFAAASDTPGLKKLHKGAKMYANQLQRYQHFLFHELGNDCKATCVLAELKHELKKNQKHLLDGTKTMEDIYYAAGKAINNDFGGANTEMKGAWASSFSQFLNSQLGQDLTRVVFLGPDWTRSNMAMVKDSMFLFSENKETREIARINALKLSRALVRGTFFMLAGNMIMSVLDDETFYERYMRAIQNKSYGGYYIEISPILNVMGLKTSRDTYFSPYGQYLDTARAWTNPVSSIYWKGSPINQAVMDIQNVQGLGDIPDYAFNQIIKNLPTAARGIVKVARDQSIQLKDVTAIAGVGLK